MSRIDKSAVRRSFDRAARYYDEHARLQRAVMNRLLAQTVEASSRFPHPTLILDAGAGSGFGIEALNTAFPGGLIVGLDFAHGMLELARRKPCRSALVCGDIEKMPFPPSVFDLAYSSSALQWSDDIKTALCEFRRVLKEKSALLIAVYTAGTLRELQDSWLGTDNHAHTLEFPTPDQLCDSLTAAGMAISSCTTQNEVVLYESVDALLGALRCTGVRNFRRDRHAGLTTLSRLKSMKTAYRARYATPQKIPASYRVTFISASPVWSRVHRRAISQIIGAKVICRDIVKSSKPG